MRCRSFSKTSPPPITRVRVPPRSKCVPEFSQLLVYPHTGPYRPCRPSETVPRTYGTRMGPTGGPSPVSTTCRSRSEPDFVQSVLWSFGTTCVTGCLGSKGVWDIPTITTLRVRWNLLGPVSKDPFSERGTSMLGPRFPSQVDPGDQRENVLRSSEPGRLRSYDPFSGRIPTSCPPPSLLLSVS